jgi:hypothetical protein
MENINDKNISDKIEIFRNISDNNLEKVQDLLRNNLSIYDKVNVQLLLANEINTFDLIAPYEEISIYNYAIRCDNSIIVFFEKMIEHDTKSKNLFRKMTMRKHPTL